MTDYGVVPTGFELKPMEIILQEIQDAQTSTIDPALDVSANTPLGQANAIVAKKIAELWELANAVYESVDPDTNEGAAQDNICAISGTTRRGPTKSTVITTCTFTAAPPDNTFPAGTRAQVAGQTDNTWVSVEDVEVTGAGDVAVNFESENDGAQVANDDTLTVILTPVTGWSAITNDDASVDGSALESDTALRLRREDELADEGSSTVGAIRSAVLKVSGVKQVFVFENTSLVTDGAGLPPKSIQVVIYDGASPAADDNEIAQALWDNKPGGIPFYGSESGTAVDTTGVEQTVAFQRAEIVSMYVAVQISIDTDLFQGDSYVKDAIVAKSLLLQGLNTDVIVLAYRGDLLTSVAGVVDVPIMQVDNQTPLTTFSNYNYTIGARQVAVFSAARIAVTHV